MREASRPELVHSPCNIRDVGMLHFICMRSRFDPLIGLTFLAIAIGVLVGAIVAYGNHASAELDTSIE